ncbi:MAG: addiction module protein [Gammaproteobacteria bacterium]|nr:addiction module protein [Gammaproteobacteria bacterium]
MARAITEIEEEIRSLGDDDKARLLRLLLEDLEGPTDPDAERLWLAEIQQRSHELDSGLVTPVPADQVFANARDALPRR